MYSFRYEFWQQHGFSYPLSSKIDVSSSVAPHESETNVVAMCASPDRMWARMCTDRMRAVEAEVHTGRPSRWLWSFFGRYDVNKQNPRDVAFLVATCVGERERERAPLLSKPCYYYMNYYIIYSVYQISWLHG